MNWRHDGIVERRRARARLALSMGTLGAILGAGIAMAAHAAVQPLLTMLSAIAQR